MREIAKDTRSKLLKEQFIPDHVLLYIVKGGIRFFDGDRTYVLREGECGLARKNRLVKFVLEENQEGFEPLLFCFDEPFLKEFQAKHKVMPQHYTSNNAIVPVAASSLMEEFIKSIKPYYKGVMALDEAFEDLKYEELLIILLRTQPELANIIFDYEMPGKIDLEEFMNRNFRFNVDSQRFAYLTGRSLSAFKRDFKAIFHETPGKWLVQKRLDEAYFLIGTKKQKPSDIYLDLGFESLSHFSFVFKKRFGRTPTGLVEDPIQ